MINEVLTFWRRASIPICETPWIDYINAKYTIHPFPAIGLDNYQLIASETLSS